MSHPDPGDAPVMPELEAQLFAVSPTLLLDRHMVEVFSSRTCDNDGGCPLRGDDGGWRCVERSKARKKKLGFSEARASELEQALNIRFLARTLCSSEARGLFADGWAYDCVQKGGEAAMPTQETFEYFFLPVAGNRWKDHVRFRRPHIGGAHRGAAGP